MIRILATYVLLPATLVIGWVLLGLVAVVDTLCGGTGNPDFPERKSHDTKTRNHD
jgi:hypothetical protein